MTSTALSTPAASGARVTAHVPRLSFGGVLRSEWIKFSSLRSIRITLIVTVLMGLGLSTLMAFIQSDNFAHSSFGPVASGGLPDEVLVGYLLTGATFAAPFLALIFGVLGVFAISSEYSSGMILSTLAAVPRRSPVFVAKAVMLALIAGVTALVLVLGGLGVGLIFLPEAASQLGSSTVLSGAFGTVAYLVLIALFAYGVAGLLRSTAGGIAVVAGATFVLPIAFQVLTLTSWEWVPTALEYLPMNLGNTLAQGASEASADPGFWPALIAMAVWAAATVIPAAILFKARDAK